MNAEQNSGILDNLKKAGGLALGIGIVYAAFITIRAYAANAGEGPSIGLSFALSFVSCAAPLFVFLFIGIGVVTILQSKSDTQSQ